MSRGYWFAGIAIGLVIAFIGIGSYKVIEYQRQQAEQRYNAAETDARNASDCFREIQPFLTLVCLYEVAQADAESERSQYDLQAQQEMAVWAYAMLWVSIASATITGIGVIYVAATLREARATTKAAIDGAHAAKASVTQAQLATNAAEETVKVTREIGQAQVMAYLSVEYCHLIRTGANEFGLHIGFKNSGQTPARNVTVDARVSVTIRVTKSANQPSVRPVNIVVGLSHGPNRRYRNRTHFSYVAAGGIVEMERDLLPSDGVDFTPPDGGHVEADFTFMIGINYQSVFPGIIQENHDWRADRCAMISVGDKFVGRPAFDIHDAEEYFDTYKPPK